MSPLGLSGQKAKVTVLVPTSSEAAPQKFHLFFCLFLVLCYCSLPYPFWELGRWSIRKERLKERMHPEVMY